MGWHSGSTGASGDAAAEREGKASKGRRSRFMFYLCLRVTRPVLAVVSCGGMAMGPGAAACAVCSDGGDGGVSCTPPRRAQPDGGAASTAAAVRDERGRLCAEPKESPSTAGCCWRFELPRAAAAFSLSSPLAGAAGPWLSALGDARLAAVGAGSEGAAPLRDCSATARPVTSLESPTEASSLRRLLRGAALASETAVAAVSATAIAASLASTGGTAAAVATGLRPDADCLDALDPDPFEYRARPLGEGV